MVFQNQSSPLHKYNKFEVCARLLPFASIPCLFVTMATETVPPITGHAFGKLFIGSCGILVITASELKLVHMTSSTTGVIFTLLHNIPLVLCGVVFMGDKITVPQFLGFLCTLAGSLFYALVTDIKAEDVGGPEEHELLANHDSAPSETPLTPLTSGDTDDQNGENESLQRRRSIEGKKEVASLDEPESKELVTLSPPGSSEPEHVDVANAV